jgi:hypothetical protein
MLLKGLLEARRSRGTAWPTGQRGGLYPLAGERELEVDDSRFTATACASVFAPPASGGR